MKVGPFLSNKLLKIQSVRSLKYLLIPLIQIYRILFIYSVTSHKLTLFLSDGRLFIMSYIIILLCTLASNTTLTTKCVSDDDQNKLPFWTTTTSTLYMSRVFENQRKNEKINELFDWTVICLMMFCTRAAFTKLNCVSLWSD